MGTSLRRGLWAALVPLLLAPPRPATAASLPSGFAETRVASGLSSVTAMTIHPDGRVFVCEQGGRLRIVKNDALLSTPFVTVSVNASGERGLLGVAVDPDYATNRWVYIYHTTSSSPIHNRIVRYTARADNPDVADAGSAQVIFNLPNLSSATNHNGGAIHFGPDGMLYVAVGENANPNNAPSLNTTLGKMLRIRKDGTIPSDNPFFDQTTGNNRAIWARGLRNPFTFGFQRGTGRMHVNDVGQNSWEEVNHGQPGRNYGWPATEGPNPPGQAGVTYPIFNYQNAGSNCAVVGAAFYNPVTAQFPAAWVGRYFYGDFCGGFIRYLSPPNYASSSAFATAVPFLVDLAVSPDGFLYYLARGQQGTGSNGQVWKVRSTTGCAPPAITDQPDSLSVTAGQTAAFSVAATGTQPLSYQWQRAAPGSNTFQNVSGATSPTLSFTAQLSDNQARYRAMVTNACPGTVTSSAATLTVTSAGPTAQITTPADGTTYHGGQLIQFAGIGRDGNGNPLPASAYTWQVDFHHADHTHPHLPPTPGITSGSFTTSDRGHTETDVFYRIHLTVTSGGQQASDSVDVDPEIVRLTIATNPSGLRATLDGQPVTAPHGFDSVVGVFRSIGTSTPQTSGGTTWNFDSWSDGGALEHEFRTPDANTTYTARFIAEPGDCVVGASGDPWLNRPFTSQSGTFTVEFDATPSVRPISGHVGLSLGPQNAYTGFANIVRFNTSGNVDARNGGTYSAASTIPYQANTTYHFRLVVNVPAHTYSIFVTPEGGSEATVGSNFAFRGEQSGVASLNYWGVYVGPSPTGQLTVCNFQLDTPPPPTDCVAATAGGGYVNRAFANQTGAFTVEFDATPSADGIDSTMSLSNGAQAAHTGFAVLARFNASGNIDARDGGTYSSAATLPYSGGQTYHFRVVVSVATRTYSVFVTPPGGPERTVGADFAFRSEQSGVTQLNNRGVWVGSPSGARNEVCDFQVSSEPPPPPTCVTAATGQGFVNRAFDNQTGTFTAEFDATPSVGGINSTIGLSNGPQSAHTGFAALARFNTSGSIDARNGGTYSAASTIPYSGGQTYHFRLALNVPAHTYSIFVTPPGGSEVTVGSNFAFRSEQSGVAQLNSWGGWVGSPSGAETEVCGFTVAGGPLPPETNVAWSGVRSSGYGISPFPSPQGWTSAMTAMSGYFAGATPAGVWLVGEVDFGSTGMLLEFPHPGDGRDYGPLVVFQSTDKHEAYLDYFDSRGIKVWLQLEPGFANMNDLIDLVLNRYEHHPSVIGLGVDVEWYRNASEGGNNAPVTNSLGQAWEARVKSHNPSYTLFLKHFRNGDLPPSYRGEIVFVNDSQDHGSLASFLSEMDAFADFFFPSPVLFQFGYETDQPWWSGLASPIPKTIGDRLRAQTRQQCGMIWVDFTLRDVLPSE